MNYKADIIENQMSSLFVSSEHRRQLPPILTSYETKILKNCSTQIVYFICVYIVCKYEWDWERHINGIYTESSGDRLKVILRNVRHCRSDVKLDSPSFHDTFKILTPHAHR